jgi:hypothetical protein
MAHLGTHAAMLMHIGMTLAFSRTFPAGDGIGFDLCPEKPSGRLRLSRENGTRRSAYIRTIQIRADAVAQLSHTVLR